MKATRGEVLRVFGEDRVIAVIRAATTAAAERAALALSQAGVRLVEITLTVPGAVNLIEKLAKSPEVASRSILGAGTVLDASQAIAALDAGARFLVSPISFPEMASLAHQRDAASMPGTMTPTEMMQAASAGADLIKIYPVASLGGASFVSQVRRTLGHLPLVATGNIAFEEIGGFLAAGVVGFGIGDPLVRPDLIESGDIEGFTANVRRFLSATRRA